MSDSLAGTRTRNAVEFFQARVAEEFPSAIVALTSYTTLRAEAEVKLPAQARCSTSTVEDFLSDLRDVIYLHQAVLITSKVTRDNEQEEEEV